MNKLSLKIGKKKQNENFRVYCLEFNLFDLEKE